MTRPDLLILAGGYGKRIAEITNGIHKSLLKLDNNQTILSRLISQAIKNGVNKIYVLHFVPAPSLLIEEAQKTVNNSDISLEFIQQDPKKYYGTMYALKIALNTIKPFDRLLVVEGDVVMSDSLARKVFTSNSHTFFIDDTNKTDDESMKVKIDGKKITYFGKDLKNHPEFIGAFIIDNTWAKAFLSETHNVTITNPFYEFVFNVLATKKMFPSYTVVKAAEWNEIDNATDLNETKEKMKLWRLKST